jgi:hypothetical protein
MLKTSALALGLLLGLTQLAFAQQEESYFSERNQSYCRNSDPEFTAWFFGATDQVPQIHQILGPVRDQGYTNQCYALAAADMLTQYSKVRVSGEQVAYLYYQHSAAGTLQRFFGNNAGGFVASAVESAEGQSLCSETSPVILRQDPSHDSQPVFCQQPAVKIGRIGTRGQPTRGLGNGHQLFQMMDEVLNKGKIVGVSYQAQVIFPTRVQVSAFNSFANHANTIVARQWNPRSNTCDYVIRNTWGESCGPSVGLCSRGYYSISEKFIDAAVQKVDYIK